MGVLEFMPAGRRVMRLLATEPAKFAEEHGVKLHEVSQEVAKSSLDFMRTFSLETPPEWFGYLVVEGESQQTVGVCSFKGPPIDGALEIAYYTFPGFEGRGIGTEMARFLVERARQLPKVKRVIAYTAAENNASTHILEKLGFTFTGEERDETVTVWRWAIELEG
jgi:ribosomal-protein-alanine N-acetyltransferase